MLMYLGPIFRPHVTQGDLLLYMFGLPGMFLILIAACRVGSNAAEAKPPPRFQFRLSDLMVYNITLAISIGLQLLSVRWLEASHRPSLYVAALALRPLNQMPYLAAAAALLWLFVAHFKPLSFLADGKFRRSGIAACVVGVMGSLIYVALVVAIEVTQFRF